MYLGISVWSIYKLIQLDPTFPVHNIGVKKNYVVNQNDLISWMESRSRKKIRDRLGLPSGNDLLKLNGDANA